MCLPLGLAHSPACGRSRSKSPCPPRSHWACSSSLRCASKNLAALPDAYPQKSSPARQQLPPTSLKRTPRQPGPTSRKLLEEAHVSRIEELDIVDVIQGHCQPLHAHAKGES